tara:strand:- start:1090 stop:2238 length:1149 start_codon:yes stop_codon:yes gene_type:complete
MKNFSLVELEALKLIELGRGKVISKKDLNANPGNYPVYSSAKTGGGVFGTWGNYDFNEEMITWSVDGGGDLFHRNKHKFSITNVGGFIRVLDKNRINTKYLYYALKNLHNGINFDWVKKAHPSVLRKEYNYIPVPSLQEQEKIVERLDEVFENIDKLTQDLTKSIKNSKNLFFSFLNETFRGNGSEDLIELEKLSTYISRGLQPKYTDKSKTLVINQRCIRDNQINFEVSRYHDQNIKKVSDDKKIQIGDILINSTGVGTLGRVAQVTELPSSDVTVDTHVTIFRPNFNILNKEFTNWLFIYLENLIEKMGVGASGQTELRREDLKNMKIINPPNEKIQQNISDKLNNLKNPYDNYLRLKEDLIIKYSMLRKSILDKEFSHE